MRISPIFALSLLGTLLGGCSEWVEELWYKGTTKGVALCQAKGAGQNLSPSTTRNICTRKHQQSVSSSFDGTAGYGGHIDEPYFHGSITNTSADVVVTKYSIFLIHHNTSDKRTEVVFEDRWIEP